MKELIKWELLFNKVLKMQDKGLNKFNQNT